MESNRHETLPHPSAPPADAVRTAPTRFVYAGGDRPLDGFTIKRGVGQGGFGEIYYAVSDAGKEVALKLIRRNLDVELRGIRQCLNLKHPHLLDLYDIRQDAQGDTWVVMEFLAGRNLEGVLAAQPNGLPIDEALAWIHGIGAGVAYLHDHGIVHRDLKPGNIFCHEGVVKLGDYGLSKYISCSRRSGHTESIGTVHYMAPEVANGRYGREIDVYALGVILYELLTGRVPFEGESIGEVLMKHLTARPDVSMLAEPYRSVVAKALEKDPALRYRSATEMLAALPTPSNKSVLFDHACPTADWDAAQKPIELDCNEPPHHGAPEHKTVAVGGLAEDPVAAWTREKWQDGKHAWGQSKLDPLLKLILVVVGCILALAYFPIILLFGGMAAIAYGVYRLVWTVFLGGTSAGEPALTNARPADATRGESAVAALVLSPPRERLAELLQAMLTSAFVAAVMCVVMVLIEWSRVDAAGFPHPEQVVWLLLVGVLGSWAVLTSAKLWEGTRVDSIVRRFVLMVVGMAVGAASFGISRLLMVGLPPVAGHAESLGYELPISFFASDGRPLLLAHVACFGSVFLLCRWWLLADPRRSSRLSLWRTLVSVVVAALVALVWQFPQPWLPMIVGAIAVAVQLASPNRRTSSRWPTRIHG